MCGLDACLYLTDRDCRHEYLLGGNRLNPVYDSTVLARPAQFRDDIGVNQEHGSVQLRYGAVASGSGPTAWRENLASCFWREQNFFQAGLRQ